MPWAEWVGVDPLKTLIGLLVFIYLAAIGAKPIGAFIKAKTTKNDTDAGRSESELASIRRGDKAEDYAFVRQQRAESERDAAILRERATLDLCRERELKARDDVHDAKNAAMVAMAESERRMNAALIEVGILKQQVADLTRLVEDLRTELRRAQRAREKGLPEEFRATDSDVTG